jgi:hypothetical protein
MNAGEEFQMVENPGLNIEGDYSEVKQLRAEVERLRAALHRAGDRLAQVQPGVTEPWAFDIVPKAEQEIAAALGEEA